jgi:hypothetical protein
VLQSALSRFATDKILNNLQLVFTTGLKSPGIMEDITVVVREYKFILDVMHATLQVDRHDQSSPMSWHQK